MIEVLPKTGKVSDKDLWRNVLIDMLRISGFLNAAATSDASLMLRKGTLLDLYYRVFLNQCWRLQTEGLLRQYVQKTSIRRALKGRLIFSDQLRHNLVRSERFATSAQEYSEDNIFNQILFRALSILRSVTDQSTFRKETSRLLYQFEGISEVQIIGETFERLKYDRTTERYRTAIMIAELIILNFLPDVRGGNSSVLAIMFPMETLFESYVAAALRSASRGTSFKVETQQSRHFWRPEYGRIKTIRPDIIIGWTDGSGRRRIVLDTKWKLPGDKNPADGDLKQMYAYNKYFDAEASNLVYPTAGEPQTTGGRFLGKADGECAMWFAQILDTASGRLNRKLGKQLLSRLVVNQN